MKIPSMALILLVTAILVGCESTSILNRGDNGVVRYQQFDKDTGELNLEMVLVKETHRDYENLYSEERENPNIKKVPVDDYELLVRSLEDQGFRDMAKPRLPNAEPRVEGATKAIVVENDNGMWLLLNEHTKTLDERKAFATMVQIIRNFYDSIFQLQVIDNKRGKDLFIEEQRRLKEENKKRLEK